MLLEELAAELPDARVRGIDAGLHVLLELPPGVDEAKVVERAAAAGVRVQGLADFTRAHPGPPALVLGYGLPGVRDLREAVGVGFLGGFTTFSTFSVQIVIEADGGRPGTAAAYLLASVLGGIAAAAGGYALGRTLA